MKVARFAFGSAANADSNASINASRSTHGAFVAGGGWLMIVQECGEVFAAMLERSLDGAQASPSHFRDFVNLITVDPQFNDLALKWRQLLESFLSDQTQE